MEVSKIDDNDDEDCDIGIEEFEGLGDNDAKDKKGGGGVTFKDEETVVSLFKDKPNQVKQEKVNYLNQSY